MLHEFVSDLWFDLTSFFSSARKTTWTYELYKEIAKTTQVEQTVRAYYGSLRIHWDELSQLEPLYAIPGLPTVRAYYGTFMIRWDELSQLESLSAIESFAALHQQGQFLMGLRTMFQPLRSKILNKSPLPKIGDVYSMIKEEEKHIKLIPKPV